MSKARVLGQFTKQLRLIAHITLIEQPRQREQLRRARHTLARLRRETHISDELLDRLQRDVIAELSRL